MSVPVLKLGVTGPPDDPTFLLLDARVGWRQPQLDQLEVVPGDGTLALVAIPGSGRSLTEPSGSFGGLTTPGNVALGPDGSIYLLDLAETVLKRFDPCECRFEPVPCFGGQGNQPRQLNAPKGIGICGGNLFVCDSGNHRLSVFSLRGFVLRSHWSPPIRANLANKWTPSAVGFDGRGRVFVADPANGCIHRFHASGYWETCFTGFGNVINLTIDCEDRLYVVQDGTPNIVRVVDTDGKELRTAAEVRDLASLFCRFPFVVDAKGQLDLSHICARDRATFDLNGNPSPALTGTDGALRYPASGSYLSGPLDSKLYRCQWHRIVLRGSIPAGSRVRVETHTAEAEVPIAQIQNLPNDAWETQQTVREIAGVEWDCLVRSGGGRFLWLRLTFLSKGAATPVIESIRIEFPRISLRRYLPAVFGAEPTSADFTDRFLSIFDTTLRSIEQLIDQQARLFDPDSAPGHSSAGRLDFLTWLGTWIGVTLDRQWPETKRRQLLKEAARLYNLRGTREGLWRQLLLFLDMDQVRRCCAGDQPQARCQPPPSNCEPVVTKPCAWRPPPLILEHYQLRRWLFLGSARLGDQAVLWGRRIANRSQLNEGAQTGHTQLITTQDPDRDPFHFYAHKFTVFVPARLANSDRQRKALETLLNVERPAHTVAQVEFVAPRFRIGVQSMIGFDSVVGRYPSGVTLNESPLGVASVLGAPLHRQGQPALEIGSEARIGTTTKLE
jgi:phage tail-like protein